MASSRHHPPPPKPLDLDLTIVSAKHLKNVNWKNGDLKPYAIFWIQPDRRLATKSDDHGSTSPVWNETFTLPLSAPLSDSVLNLEIFHSEPSETPKPLVGTLRFHLRDLAADEDHKRLRTLLLTRPSGRPQGKIRVRLNLRERILPPDYQTAPPPSYYYSSAPPLAPARDYRSYSVPPYASPYSYTSSVPLPATPPPPAYPYVSYPESYSGYHSSAPPPPPPRPFMERNYSVGGGCGPSAPVDYAHYDQKGSKGSKGSKVGLGAGLAVGAVAGTLGGLALEEGLKYKEEKIVERAEKDLASRDDDYSDYRPEY